MPIETGISRILEPLSNFLPLAGGTMLGDIQMDNNTLKFISGIHTSRIEQAIGTLSISSSEDVGIQSSNAGISLYAPNGNINLDKTNSSIHLTATDDIVLNTNPFGGAIHLTANGNITIQSTVGNIGLVDLNGNIGLEALNIYLASGTEIYLSNATCTTTLTALCSKLGLSDLSSITAPGQLKPNITRYTMPGWAIVRTTNNMQLDNGKIYYVPFFVATTTTYSEILVQVYQGGSAGNLADLRIFAWNDGVPGVLVSNCGTVATDVAGNGPAVININLTLNRGFYFFAIKNNNVATFPYFECVNYAYPFYAPVTGISNAQHSDPNNATNYITTTVVSAYADPAPAPTAISGIIPIFLLREN
jgi:hypothetical protein